MTVWLLLALHVAAAAVVLPLADRVGRWVFLIPFVPAVATTVWVLPYLDTDRSTSTTLTWVEGLDLELVFHVDTIGALMTLLVSGIGALVFLYAAGYMTDTAAHLGRFAATLTAFSTAMLGLVWADNVWTLFVFWELTSITSFLLVGHKDVDAGARLAARRALVITVAGGLVLLAGLVLLVDATGVSLLSEMGPVAGSTATAAAVLVLIAAATKSAQAPFHVWLPGAMAAPTPVSAYLHSATMVKAGVLLVALTGPVLGDTSVWTPLGVAFGATSMVWGAVGALRHVDAKLILAWGTVSQLGLMIVLLALDSAKATFAAIAIVLAHAVFKAALFMVVGEIDIRTGTRDVDRLGGLWRTMPVAFAVAVVSAASMAGIPPLLGFPAKEAAVEAALGLDGTERWVALITIVGGSVLTVAYTLRFVVRTFGPAADGSTTAVGSPRWAMTAPAVALGVASVVGFVALDAVTRVVRNAAVELDPDAIVYELLRWPGLTQAFVVSVAIVAGGVVLGAALARGAASDPPRPIGAGIVDLLIDRTATASKRIAGVVQHGSLPVYLVTMVATAVAATTPFWWSLDLDVLDLSDNTAQTVLAALVMAAALAASTVQTRLGAALALGAVGVGVSGLFVAHGAPDLALTQLLVETVIVVGFVAGLGRLTRRFPPMGHVWRGIRIAAAAAVGVVVMVALAASGARPAGTPPLEELTEESADVGGGNNIVNVILTDDRALDTLGEIMVLAVAAIGIVALSRAGREVERS